MKIMIYKKIKITVSNTGVNPVELFGFTTNNIDGVKVELITIIGESIKTREGSYGELLSWIKNYPMQVMVSSNNNRALFFYYFDIFSGYRPLIPAINEEWDENKINIADTKEPIILNPALMIKIKSSTTVEIILDIMATKVPQKNNL